MKTVYLEGINRSIDIVACKAGEFPKVMDQATRLLAADAGDISEVVKDVVDTWAPGLDHEQLTLDDAWNILLAKAGRLKGEVLSSLPQAFAKNILDFLATPEGSQVIKTEAQKILTSSGEDI